MPTAADVLRETVAALTRDAMVFPPEELKSRYRAFRKKYPVLFEMAVQPGFDIARMEQAASLLDRVANGQLTAHDASVAFGQSLFDDFVAPRLPPPG
jgi:hypothetical protein